MDLTIIELVLVGHPQCPALLPRVGPGRAGRRFRPGTQRLRPHLQVPIHARPAHEVSPETALKLLENFSKTALKLL